MSQEENEQQPEPTEAEEEEVQEAIAFPEGLKIVPLDRLKKDHEKSIRHIILVKVIHQDDVKMVILGKNKSKSERKISFVVSGRFQDRFGNQAQYSCWSKEKFDIDIDELPDDTFAHDIANYFTIGQYYRVYMFEVKNPVDDFTKSRFPNDTCSISFLNDDNHKTQISDPISESDVPFFLEPPPPIDFHTSIAEIPTLYNKLSKISKETRPFFHLIAVVEGRTEILEKTSNKHFGCDNPNPSWGPRKYQMSELSLVDESETSIKIILWTFSFNAIQFDIGQIVRLQDVEVDYNHQFPNIYKLKAKQIYPLTFSMLSDEKQPERIVKLHEWVSMKMSVIETTQFPSLSDPQRKHQVSQQASSSSSSVPLPTPVPNGQPITIQQLLDIQHQAKQILENANLTSQTKELPSEVSSQLPKGVYTILVDVEKIDKVTSKSKSILEAYCTNNHPKQKPLFLSKSDGNFRCSSCGGSKEIDDWRYGIACCLKVSDHTGNMMLHAYDLSTILQQNENVSTDLEELLVACRVKQDPSLTEDESLTPTDHTKYNEIVMMVLENLVTTNHTQLIQIRVTPNLYEGVRFYFACSSKPNFYQ